jgi:homoserine O-acetyltransferase/O-succinyltransferase
MNSFSIPNFELECGAIISEAKLVYQTYGELNSDRSNVILYPTSYGAQHFDTEWLIRSDSILDPTRYFIVIPNMFGNGLSSSPSNCAECELKQEFWFSHWDNVRAQEKLLSEVFRVDRMALIYGWSMGAQQAYHWGALYPERVERIAAICGTARTTDHNQIFLQSLRSALTSDPTWTGSSFDGIPDRGFHTFALIYASWAASPAFYRDRLYEQFGYKSLDDYLLRAWEENYRRRDPCNLIAAIDTWLRCDVSRNSIFNGDYKAAMAAIQAKTLVMPSKSDLYFTAADCMREALMISKSRYQDIPSIWGHRAGNPYQNPEDESFIRQAIADLLSN